MLNLILAVLITGLLAPYVDEDDYYGDCAELPALTALCVPDVTAQYIVCEE
jgi:hypothetical protein